jgi:WD40 repeat protein
VGRLWHIETRRVVRRYNAGGGVLSAVGFSPDGKTVYTGGSDGMIRAWNSGLGEFKGDPANWQPGLGQEKLPHKGHIGALRAIMFAPDGRTLLSVGMDHTIRRWDLKAKKELSICSLLGDQGPQVVGSTAPVITPDGRTVFVVCRDGTIRACDTTTGKDLRRSAALSPVPDHLAVAPSGRTLAVASAFHHSIALYDAAGLHEKRRWDAHHDGITSLRFAADGRRLASTSHDRTLRLWDLGSGEELPLDGEPSASVYTSGLSPDGQTLAVPAPDGVRFFDLVTGKPSGSLRAPDYASAVAFSPDGQYLATVHRNQILLWETGTGIEVARFAPCPMYTQLLQFSPDGQVLATAGTDGAVLLWDLTTCRTGPPRAADQPEDLWDQLAGPNGGTAHRACWSLSFTPTGAVALLERRLEPVKLVDDKQIREWIRRLDDAGVGKRDSAEAELERLGARGEPALRQALATEPSAEARLRLARLLDSIHGLIHTSAVARERRAVAVLGRIASAPKAAPEAKTAEAATALLEKLAGGEPRALLTLAAQAARGRLGKSPPSDPAGPPARTEKTADATAPTAKFVTRLGSLPFEPSEQLCSVAYAPDGKTLAFAVNGQSIRIWDAADGKELRRWAAPVHIATVLAFSPEGKELAAGGLDKLLHRWDPATGKALPALRGHGEYVTGICFSTDGKQLASASADSIRIWNIGTGKEVLQCKSHGPGSVALAFAPDGRMLASAGSDGSLRFLDAMTGKELRRLQSARATRWLAFSPDGQRLAAAGPTRAPVLWDVKTGAEATGFQGPRVPVQALAFSPNGKVLAFGLATGELILLDAASGRQLHSLRPRGHVSEYVTQTPDGALHHTVVGQTDLVTALAFAPDSTRLAAVATDHSLRVWDVAGGKRVLPKEYAAIIALAFGHDGRTLLAVGDDHRVRTWDSVAAKIVHEFAFPPFHRRGIVLSPNGRTLAVNDFGGSLVHMHDLTSRPENRRMIVMEEHASIPRRSAMALGVSADGHTLATADFQGLLLWDVAGLKIAGSPNATPASTYPWAIAFAPDGRTIAVGNTTEPPYLYDLAKGRRLPKCQGRRGGDGMPVFSPDGRTVYQGCEDRYLYLWETSTGKFRGPLLELQNGGAAVLAVSPDGLTLASAGFDHIIYLWDPRAGKMLGRLSRHNEVVKALAFSPDGKRLASGSVDGTIAIWELPERTEPAQERKPEELQRLWGDLDSPDAMRAYRAIQALERSREQIVPFLAQRLQPAPGPDAKQVAALIADLDSDAFAVRERSSRTLAELGVPARPALQKALQANPSTEARSRIEAILRQIAQPAPVPSRQPQLRALEILERLATPAARDLLERLAGGAVGDPLTEDARATLQRMGARKRETP